VDSVGVRPCRIVWMQSCLLLLSSFSSFVAVLSNLLLSGFRNRCQSLWSLIFSSIFYLINIRQPYALSMSVCSGVAFQPVNYIVLLKNLTAASIPFSVLRETFKVHLPLMRGEINMGQERWQLGFGAYPVRMSSCVRDTPSLLSY
jgi:hypothetical protein